jgi:diguanylate cyclase (GGDEF)-like protein
VSLTAYRAALRRWLSHATEPQLLYPALAFLALAALWSVTFALIRAERAAAERAAAVSSHELVETYEAQVLRALREIDQALKLVKFGHEIRGRPIPLQVLGANGLLPPDLLFTVSITDGKGNVVASTRPAEVGRVADPAHIPVAPGADELAVSRPRQASTSAPWRLQFSRRLATADDSLAGVATISVEADYFVSGYEPARLGERGLLAILGTDGVFRAQRSGETVSAGDRADYALMLLTSDDTDSKVTTLTSSIDGVERYVRARRLHGFPLIVIVGLSVDEHLSVALGHRRTFLWRASAGSLALVLLFALLGRLSYQLALSRRLAAEEHVAHATRIEYLAYHDGLTTLANRSLFSNLLGQSIQQARRYHRHLALLFLDLDRFKHINDTLGHDAGDLLLQQVAQRLKACLRESDTVARLGGDEFVVLLPELDTQEYAATVARKILAAVARPFTLLGNDYRVTASVGIGIYPQDGLDEQTLTRNADVAMYQAKIEGKNKFQFFSAALNASSLERLTLESGLRHALARNEFQLEYQVKREIRSGRISGFEALLRWQHPDLGTVAPMRFLPLAEETGLIVPIGRWALLAACRQNVAWHQEGLPRLVMAVNLSARQFHDENLLPDVAAILAECGMEARLLELEITESLLMRDAAGTLRVLGALKAMGVRIAIDDFGIGYASLPILKRFPLDTIKIDRSFIHDVASIAEGKSLATALIALGRVLSQNVVAQGVETKEQAEFLGAVACDQLQGFYLNKPEPGERIAQLLRAQAPGPQPTARAAP